MKKVFCIHGFNSHLDFMKRLLPKGYICINNRSYTAKIFDAEECVRFWQEEYSNTLEEYDNIIVVAHSFGCFVALHLDCKQIAQAFLLTPFLPIHLHQDNIAKRDEGIYYLETSHGRLPVTAKSYEYVQKIDMKKILSNWNTPTILCTGSDDLLTPAAKTNSYLVQFGGKVTSLQIQSNHFLEGEEDEVKRIITDYA